MIEIKEITTKKDISVFASYPLKLYKGCPYYVPSLRSDEKNSFDKEKNFALGHCDAKGFLCYKDGELVGRIAGIINWEDNRIENKKFVRFSRFECIDDIEVFKALLGAVEKYGKENGMEIIHGPWGFNDTDREGMLTYGFNERSTYATNYCYPYFSENMKKLGFDDESKWLELRFDLDKTQDTKVVRVAEKLKKRLKVRDVSNEMSIKKLLKNYGVKLFDTYNQSYSSLDGYVPIEGKEMQNVLDQFATICNPRYISVLVDENEDVAAFGVALPSICNSLIKHKGKLFPTGFIDVLKNISKPKELELALIGVRDKYKNSGITSIMISKILNNVKEDGILRVESNPMLEHNYNIQAQWQFAETAVVKRRQTFIKDIGSLIKE